MKLRKYMLVLVLLFACLSSSHAQEYGQIRALRQRADVVIKQKNDFVAKVLTSYSIPHERNAAGAVARIYTDSQWLDVTTIEIIPLLNEAADKRQQIAAHELLFYTSKGILDLVSEAIIR